MTSNDITSWQEIFISEYVMTRGRMFDADSRDINMLVNDRALFVPDTDDLDYATCACVICEWQDDDNLVIMNMDSPYIARVLEAMWENNVRHATVWIGGLPFTPALHMTPRYEH